MDVVRPSGRGMVIRGQQIFPAQGERGNTLGLADHGSHILFCSLVFTTL